MILPKLYIVV